MTQESSWDNFLRNNLQTGLLVVAAFVIGYLWSQVRMKDSSPTVANNNQNVEQNAPAQPQVPLSQVLSDADIEAEKIISCMQSDEYADEVAASFAEGQELGVTGTPGNFIMLADGRGEPIQGALPYASLSSLIDQYLEEDGSSQTEELSVNITDGHVRGAEDAPVTIVEYSDFDCPYCARFHDTMLQVMEEYDGQVRWVYRHYPIEQLHPNAPKIAEASECIANLDGEEAFWRFADTYYATKSDGTQITLE